MAPYQYFPLQRETSDIRILVLHPGDFDEAIRISLVKTSLGKGSSAIDDTRSLAAATDGISDIDSIHERSEFNVIGVYEALSYAWGTAEDKRAINIGSQDDACDEILIHKGLFDVLQHLRKTDQARLMWIDALCIDQTNATEKSFQITLMGEIYRCAKRVVVWLGTEGSDSDYAMGLLKDVGSKVNVEWTDATMKPSKAGLGQPYWADRALWLPFGQREYQALLSLFTRPWFERLWVRQEVKLSNHVGMICGRKRMTWNCFRNAIFCISSKKRDVELLGEEQYTFEERLGIILTLCNFPIGTSLLDLHTMLQGTKCLDPRDRIYGVLKLLSSEMDIEPNYDLTVAQVYKDAFLRHLKHYANVYLLASCHLERSLPDLPGWVPDWSVDGPIRFPIVDETTNCTGPFLASAECLEGRTLRVAGMRAAVVEHVKVLGFSPDSYRDPWAFLRVLRKIVPHDILFRPYAKGGTLLEAYCRTLCGDKTNSYAVSSKQVGGLPNMQLIKQSMLDVLLIPQDTCESAIPSLEASKYNSVCVDICMGRVLVTTSEGYVGLVPEKTQVGDVVCIVLGCEVPLVLRPTETEHASYLVVGECFLCGAMSGEALLGPVPSGFRMVSVAEKGVTRPSVWKALNLDTKKFQSEDPRLHTLFPDVDLAERRANADGERLDMTVDELREAGLDIEFFELA